MRRADAIQAIKALRMGQTAWYQATGQNNLTTLLWATSEPDARKRTPASWQPFVAITVHTESEARFVAHGLTIGLGLTIGASLPSATVPAVVLK